MDMSRVLRVKFVNDHPALSVVGLFAGSLFIAGQIANALHLSSGVGAALWLGLVATGFVAADKLEAAERTKAKADATTTELRQLRERTAQLEREMRERDERETRGQ
jgi:hypothetical protein